MHPVLCSREVGTVLLCGGSSVQSGGKEGDGNGGGREGRREIGEDGGRGKGKDGEEKEGRER